MKSVLNKAQIVAIFAIAMIAVLFTGSAQAQDANDPNNSNLFDVNRVLTLNITMDPGDWETLRFSCPDPYGSCPPPPHTYYQATFQCGTVGPILVGIRRKSDRGEPNQADPQKVSLKLDINLYVAGQLFAGKKKLSLESGSQGATVTEGISWQIYQAAGGFVASRSAWCKVYVNGSYKGLYSNVEQIDKMYLIDHGLDDGGFLFKHAVQGTPEAGVPEDQRTRETPPETSPFAFNWYPFDHPNPNDENNVHIPIPNEPNIPPEGPAPSDWRDQAQWRVNIPHVLTLAAAENFIANADAAVLKMNNYFYYDWSTEPNDDPNYQQPRLYFPWDLDTVMKDAQANWDIIAPSGGGGSGHLWHGLIRELDESGTPFAEPTFQADYLTVYKNLMDGPLALANTLALVNNIESVISTDMDADPYQRTGSAASEFQAIRDFLTARTASVTAQLDALFPPPGTILLDDGFEGTPWDANWSDVTSAWTNETTRVHTDSNAAGADRGGGTGYFTSNALDANYANAIHIRFYFQQDQAATFTVEYNGSGGWSTPVDITVLGGDHEWLYYGDTITDSNYFVPDFKIRFNAAFSGGGTRSVEVDDVIITKEVPPIISGHILDPNDKPIDGVLVDANNAGGSDTTDIDGYYEVEVPFDWSGTVTPTKEDYTFEPANRLYSNVTADQTGQDYVGTSIYDFNKDGFIGFADLDVFVSAWLSGPGDGNWNAACDFYYDLTVNFKDFAKFGGAWQPE